MTFDSGVVQAQLRKLSGSVCDETIAVAAAQAAANKADAILVSLQMPMVSVPTAIVVHSSSSTSDVDASDKGNVSCDESVSESTSATTSQVIVRRSG
jgi:hypothetical protein